MTGTAHFAVACDTDPDGPIGVRRLPAGGDVDALWRGVLHGIEALRARLIHSRFHVRFGPLPITWLLRADRQIAEVYGDPSFTFKRYAAIWAREGQLGSEIGWHPHVYCWNDSSSAWEPRLDTAGDTDVLRDSLSALRAHADVRAVRTGWTYHSNRLMQLFARSDIRVDASALPGSVHRGRWRHDWTSTPRVPYLPSKRDYRVCARSEEDGVGICVLPSIVRRLGQPLHAFRYLTRMRRRLSTTWEAARWQGVLISQHDASFEHAVAQTLRLSEEAGRAFIVTYFHTGELMRRDVLDRFARNVDATLTVAERNGWELRPATLSAAGAVAEAALVRRGSVPAACR